MYLLTQPQLCSLFFLMSVALTSLLVKSSHICGPGSHSASQHWELWDILGDACLGKEPLFPNLCRRSGQAFSVLP